MNTNEFYIKRALELARNGLGTTYPNPLVGCVIVHDDKIIGEGWHIKAGDAHAEVRAINAVEDQSLLKKSKLFVTLEPCSHYGKTPPCSDLIIDKKIPNIVIGTVDPFAKVAGMGIKKLLAAGRNVVVGVCEDECEVLNKRFFTFHRKKRPYIVLKWAETKHGFIAPEGQKKDEIFWITNAYSQQLVHKWRSEEQSILVGTQTASIDNPKLNVRHWQGKNPTRVVLDKSLRLPKNLYLMDASQPTVVFHHSNLTSESKTNLKFFSLNFDSDLLPQVLDKLYELELQSVIIEGGSKTLQSFIDAGLWDEARVFIGQNTIKNGIKGPEIRKQASITMNIEDDQLKYFYND
ncbi:bifunctional diaminohydroxyphosphoribosylaminopyrimidine deaminase/5-amino-6-(5-phosphoribosylamino)uracil reductase RibD [Psychroflexus sp. CAK1W]|uniref:bifunctional diaminohydroxyphosphoribosylaminopyrimidine deaminase/5-amino-6-(5-phosphoribosylamino)uracil reductase RibD n=1 Tax=Psychroflexus curvus TaxID=2873595 RepID=UPI001CC94E30|nr:bifunctional diaminohydroxyphosphoribosylaminopyrimidine deaminase/5-amino-6-(5-phosphoribosylamino)uracil reductase RibD [Psychroflexus curvus]MBZ9627494.1 bifunctional diaminohydroxyphosphoribosylaminopyrimidine deaminase/5-amino-6-(5-phosphoribosylamino)uracil reductase RibD [Psychroflexus curvus]